MSNTPSLPRPLLAFTAQDIFPVFETVVAHLDHAPTLILFTIEVASFYALDFPLHFDFFILFSFQKGANAIRKAKKIVTYEIGLTVQLECTHTDTAAVAVVTVEKIEEDIEAGEYVIKVTCDATDKAKRACADDFDGASKEFFTTLT